MDPITQGALGAAWAQPAARRGKVAAATVVGAVAGMAPDLDLLIRSSTDPLLAIEYHRHFTHSLAFVPFGATVCALVVHPLARRWLTFRACLAFSVLGYASHGILDAFTGYGTLLLWPFSDARIAWDIVSVVDPLFTLPLIVLVALGVVRRRPSLAVTGCVWCLAYLAIGVLQHGRAEALALQLARSRDHAPESVKVKPSLGNVLLYKSIYLHEGQYYVDAVKAGLRPSFFEGETRARVDTERDFPWLAEGMQQWDDLQRFDWFADGMLALDPGRPNRIVDLRYSLVPTSADAFWGIELDPEAAPDEHAAYVTMRARSLDEGRALLQMLFR